MEPHVKMFAQFMYNEIFEDSIRNEGDLRAWIAKRDYLLSQEINSCGFSLTYNSTSLLSTSLANDCNRMAQAAFESISSVHSNSYLPKSLAWPVVRVYYASFFAAHSILRLFGRSCTQLDSVHVQKVLELAQATNQLGAVNKIGSGFYFAKTNSTERQIVFSKMKDSHADTWFAFYELLTDLIEKIPEATGLSQHRLEAMENLGDIKKAISRSGACNRGNWLSQVRNAVNYRHTYGVWFPYRNARFNTELINRSDLWKQPISSFDIRNQKNEIDIFFMTSNMILSLLHKLLSYGYNRSESKPYIFSNGSIKLMNLLGAAQST